LVYVIFSTDSFPSNVTRAHQSIGKVANVMQPKITPRNLTGV